MTLNRAHCKKQMLLLLGSFVWLSCVSSISVRNETFHSSDMITLHSHDRQSFPVLKERADSMSELIHDYMSKDPHLTDFKIPTVSGKLLEQVYHLQADF
jgi:hypothetical protein